jgi:hypothetical protein
MFHNLAAVAWCTALQEAYLDHEWYEGDSGDGFEIMTLYLKTFQNSLPVPPGKNDLNDHFFYYSEEMFVNVLARIQQPMDSIVSLHDALFPSPVYDGLLYTDTQIDKLAWLMLGKVQRIVFGPNYVCLPVKAKKEVEPDVASMIADTVLFDAAIKKGALVEEAAFTGGAAALLDAVKDFVDVLDMRENLKRPFVSVQQDDEEAALQMALRNSMTDY